MPRPLGGLFFLNIQVLITSNGGKAQTAPCNLGRKKSSTWVHYFQVRASGGESFIVMQRSQGWEQPALPRAFSRCQEKIGGSKRAILLFQRDKTSSQGEFSWEWAGGRSGMGCLCSKSGWIQLLVAFSLAPIFLGHENKSG